MAKISKVDMFTKEFSAPVKTIGVSWSAGKGRTRHTVTVIIDGMEVVICVSAAFAAAAGRSERVHFLIATEP